MENASKALIIAGSVLMAVMVIGIVTMMWDQISAIYQTESNTDAAETLAIYNNRFEQFNGTIYGSELISLANLQADYSNRKYDLQGYEDIEITVEISTEVSARQNSGKTTKTYIKSGAVYNIEEIKNAIAELEDDISEYETVDDYDYSIKYYAQLSYRQIATLFEIECSSDLSESDIYSVLLDNSSTEKLLEKIQNYTNLSSAYKTFKNTLFNCDDVDYGIAGYIVSMSFSESS